MSEVSYYKNEVKENVLSELLPPDVLKAANVIAEYQHKTGVKINFDWHPDRPAEKYLKARAAGPVLYISNLPRRAVLNLVLEDVRKKKSGKFRTPGIWLSDYQGEGFDFAYLSITGDAEKNAKLSVKWEVERGRRANAEAIAGMMLRNGHPSGAYDFDGEAE